MLENTAHVDEGTIHAWLDGALPPVERVAVEAHVAACAACAAAVAEARGLIAASARILSSLDDVPAGVIPNATPVSVERIMAAAAQPARAPAPAWTVRRYAPLAAAAVIVIVGSVVWKSAANRSVAMVVAPEAASPVAKSDVAATGGPSADAAPVTVAQPMIREPQARSPLSAPVDAGKLKEADIVPKPVVPSMRLATPPREASGGGRAGAAGYADATKDQRARGQLGAATGNATNSLMQRSAGAANIASNIASSDAEKKAPVDALAGKSSNAKLEELAKRSESAPARPATQLERRDESVAQSRQKASPAPSTAPLRTADEKQRAGGAAVSGVVLDGATGRPLEAANVSLSGTQQHASTNSVGEFFIAGVSPGTQMLTVQRIGFTAVTQSVEVTNERASSATISLSALATQPSGTTVASSVDSAAFGSASRAIEGLLLLSSATSQTTGSVVRRSIYEVRPGVQVTLVETRLLLADKASQARREQRPNRALAPSAPPPPGAVHSTGWTARDGSEMVLSGPLSVAELQTIRGRIP
ncbi:MAG: carboxypeptidase-like regulatory domain-containing protein [Gemmatimonadaceae bacterium]